ncbi:hypothetical protein SR187_3895 [Streptococcus ruminantium]|uniref:Uncharacterized protein n=1 Tax=Streptococcus ruminantium TaxID=1917441 RepID=A0A2Z5U364_9STRE|nr:hypothetical protein SR187_3895 [Streptococcus ruminantium]
MINLQEWFNQEKVRYTYSPTLWYDLPASFDFFKNIYWTLELLCHHLTSY